MYIYVVYTCPDTAPKTDKRKPNTSPWDCGNFVCTRPQPTPLPTFNGRYRLRYNTSTSSIRARELREETIAANLKQSLRLLFIVYPLASNRTQMGKLWPPECAQLCSSWMMFNCTLFGHAASISAPACVVNIMDRAFESFFWDACKCSARGRQGECRTNASQHNLFKSASEHPFYEAGSLQIHSTTFVRNQSGHAIYYWNTTAMYIGNFWAQIRSNVCM